MTSGDYNRVELKFVVYEKESGDDGFVVITYDQDPDHPKVLVGEQARMLITEIMNNIDKIGEGA